MNTLFRIISILLISLCFAEVIHLLRKKKLYLKYALLWILTGIVIISLILCPQLISWFFELCGFQVFSNGIFVVLILFILVILLALTSIASKLNENNRRLVQTVALLEKRLRNLEEDKK